MMSRVFHSLAAVKLLGHIIVSRREEGCNQRFGGGKLEGFSRSGMRKH